MKKYNLILFVFLIPFFCLAQKDKNLEAWPQAKVLEGAISSYYFFDYNQKKVLAEYNADILLNPASTLKMITCLSFLDKFGDDYRYETTVSFRGEIMQDGTLEGDVIVYGNGDPSFGSKRFGKEYALNTQLDKISQALMDAGITCVDGKLIIDASYFGTSATPSSWQYDDLGNYYAAGAWSINAEENEYKVYLSRNNQVGGHVNIARVIPHPPYLKFISELTQGTENSGDNAYIYCAPYQYTAFIRGTIPAGTSEFSIRGSIPNPPDYLGFALEESLALKGIKCTNVISTYQKQKGSNLILSIQSLPAKILAEAAIKESINLYCESFLKTMGNGDREKGVKAIQDYMVRKNVSQQKFRMQDGSGLSQRNQISARMLGRFMLFQYQKSGNSLKNLLAQSGVSGTFQNSFTKNGMRSKVFGKSGSMEGVRCYTGILEKPNGNDVIFVVMVNNYVVPNWKIYEHIEKLLTDQFYKN